MKHFGDITKLNGAELPIVDVITGGSPCQDLSVAGLRKGADSPRYKALGNSIALPFWEWMAERMVKQLKESGIDHPTMASLFDGIGGFPLVYSRCGCEPVWASEIEEFPIAVTKKRFLETEKE